MNVNLENFPTSESAQRMLGYVTQGFYDRSYVGKWLYQVMGLEMDDARTKINELAYQAFPETATWGLIYHEQKYGIVTNPLLDIEQRRKEIIRKRDIRCPLNPAKVEAIVSALTETDVVVTENIEPYTFDIKIVTEDVTSNLDYDAIRRLIGKIKPSHLFYFLNGGYRSEAIEDVIIASRLYLNSGFYPQNNTPPLILDGTWNMDGVYHLGGFKEGILTDFYPLILTLQMQLLGCPDLLYRLTYLSEYQENVASDSLFTFRALPQINIKYRYVDFFCSVLNCENKIGDNLYFRDGFMEREASDAQLILNNEVGTDLKYREVLFLLGNWENTIRPYTMFVNRTPIDVYAGAETKTKIATEVEVSPHMQSKLETKAEVNTQVSYNIDLTVEKDLWYLDGNSLLDGSHGLDPQIYHYNNI